MVTLDSYAWGYQKSMSFFKTKKPKREGTGIFLVNRAGTFDNSGHHRLYWVCGAAIVNE